MQNPGTNNTLIQAWNVPLEVSWALIYSVLSAQFSVNGHSVCFVTEFPKCRCRRCRRDRLPLPEASVAPAPSVCQAPRQGKMGKRWMFYRGRGRTDRVMLSCCLLRDNNPYCCSAGCRWGGFCAPLIAEGVSLWLAPPAGGEKNAWVKLNTDFKSRQKKRGYFSLW